MKIAFIGLGNMGKGMAINLSKNNLDVFGYDIDEKVFSKMKNHNVIKSKDIQSIVEKTEIIITMLPDGKIVEKVWEEIISYKLKNKLKNNLTTETKEQSKKSKLDLLTNENDFLVKNLKKAG